MPGLEELTMRLQTAFGSRYENYSQLVAGFLHGQVSPEAWSEQIGEFVGESPLLVALHNEYILALLDQQEAIESPNVMPTSLAHLADHEARDAAEEEALAQQAAQAWRPPMLVESLRELNLLELTPEALNTLLNTSLLASQNPLSRAGVGAQVVLYAAEAGLNEVSDCAIASVKAGMELFIKNVLDKALCSRDRLDFAAAGENNAPLSVYQLALTAQLHPSAFGPTLVANRESMLQEGMYHIPTSFHHPDSF